MARGHCHEVFDVFLTVWLVNLERDDRVPHIFSEVGSYTQHLVERHCLTLVLVG